MSEFKFTMPIQPRYADFDMLGHLNNATYLTYFEVARLHYFYTIGWRLKDVSNVVARMEIDFLAPVLPQTEVSCSIKTTELGGKSFKMAYQLQSAGGATVFSRGQSVQVCIDRATGKAISLPAHIRKLITAYEGL